MKKMEKEMVKTTCLNCNHEQEQEETKLHKDDLGTFTVCEKCESSYDV